MNVRVTTGTIMHKQTKRRDPFLLVGESTCREQVVAELRHEFDSEDYDFRTLKFADQIFTPVRKFTILRLEELQNQISLNHRG